MDAKVFFCGVSKLSYVADKNNTNASSTCHIYVDYADPCQRLFNAIEPDSYIRPNHHGIEMLFAVRGLMSLIVFNNDGAIE
ncbi:hypothetical protein MCEREM21_00328 [Burkholderiaceae bacterium]